MHMGSILHHTTLLIINRLSHTHKYAPTSQTKAILGNQTHTNEIKHLDDIKLHEHDISHFTALHLALQPNIV